MAWYTINHHCGHTAEVNLTGTNVHGQRERRAAALAKRPCPNCQATSKAANNALVSTNAATLAAEAGLPELSGGSPKQIAWAETIRMDTRAQVEDLRQRLLAALDIPGEDAELARRSLDALDEVERRTMAANPYATWWIDRRAMILEDIRAEAATLARSPVSTNRDSLSEEELLELMRGGPADYIVEEFHRRHPSVGMTHRLHHWSMTRDDERYLADHGGPVLLKRLAQGRSELTRGLADAYQAQREAIVHGDRTALDARPSWALAQVLEHVGITRSTWSAYRSRNGGPDPIRHDPATGAPLWDEAVIRAWKLARPGKPGRPRQRRCVQPGGG